jgi:hypothetical protein
MVSLLARTWIDRTFCCGKDILPLPCGRGLRVFAVKGIRQVDGATAFEQVGLMHQVDFHEMVLQGVGHRLRQHRDPVAFAFPGTDRDLSVDKIEVFDSGPHALHETQPRSIELPVTHNFCFRVSWGMLRA